MKVASCLHIMNVCITCLLVYSAKVLYLWNIQRKVWPISWWIWKPHQEWTWNGRLHVRILWQNILWTNKSAQWSMFFYSEQSLLWRMYNCRYFLMYLISKPETEFSGQVSVYIHICMHTSKHTHRAVWCTSSYRSLTCGTTTLEETGASSQLVIVFRNKKEEKENILNKAKVYKFILNTINKKRQII